MVRRRLALVAVALAAVAVNAVLGGDAVHRLPYLLAALSVVFLFQTFWDDRGDTWVVGSTGVVIAALLVSITYSVGTLDRADGRREVASRPDPTNRTATTTLLTGDAVPAAVAGAVEERDQPGTTDPGSPEDVTTEARLAQCETALATIASAIVAAGEPVPTTVAAPAGESDAGRRLQSCEIRLRAIAQTLPG